MAVITVGPIYCGSQSPQSLGAQSPVIRGSHNHWGLTQSLGAHTVTGDSPSLGTHCHWGLTQSRGAHTVTGDSPLLGAHTVTGGSPSLGTHTVTGDSHNHWGLTVTEGSQSELSLLRSTETAAGSE